MTSPFHCSRVNHECQRKTHTDKNLTLLNLKKVFIWHMKFQISKIRGLTLISPVASKDGCLLDIGEKSQNILMLQVPQELQ